MIASCNLYRTAFELPAALHLRSLNPKVLHFTFESAITDSVMRQILIVLFSTFLFCMPASAKKLPEASKQEIFQLLNKLENSNCQFSRNGSWYTSKEARVHLQRKLEYLIEKGEITSAEQFIEVGATKSSMSGKAYWVQCPGSAQIDSGTWLTGQLKQLRVRK
jgi:hypothetical protein